MNRAFARLLSGDFEHGWRDFEWRERALGWQADPRYPEHQRWRGDSLAGKIIVLRAEQGLGDTLQFCRYVVPLAKQGAGVILEAPATLVALLSSLAGLLLAVPQGASLPSFDYHCPLLSVPGALGTSLTTIPSQTPYLFADRDKVNRWRDRLGPRTQPRVGLSWSGGFRPEQPELWAVNRRRNIPLSELAPLRHAGISFYSLQKGQPAESELAALRAAKWQGPGLIDHTPWLHDFADTAAFVENLDLVITVDTSIAHLAGALGKPVWIMNRFDTCWRWLLNRNDTPWYPTARLYRQSRAGDWSDVIDKVRLDLLSGYVDGG